VKKITFPGVCEAINDRKIIKYGYYAGNDLIERLIQIIILLVLI